LQNPAFIFLAGCEYHVFFLAQTGPSAENDALEHFWTVFGKHCKYHMFSIELGKLWKNHLGASLFLFG
jgi:hypothetical protein